jgi:hypothetical protein
VPFNLLDEKKEMLVALVQSNPTLSRTQLLELDQTTVRYVYSEDCGFYEQVMPPRREHQDDHAPDMLEVAG